MQFKSQTDSVQVIVPFDLLDFFLCSFNVDSCNIVRFTDSKIKIWDDREQKNRRES